MGQRQGFFHTGDGRSPCARTVQLFLVALIPLYLGGCTTPPPPKQLLSDDALPLSSDGEVQAATNPTPAHHADFSPETAPSAPQAGARLASYMSAIVPSSSGARIPPHSLPELKLTDDLPLQRELLPSNDGPWSPDQAVLAWAEFHGDMVTVHNVRNAFYRTADDYTVRLNDRTYDLHKLTSIDFIIVPFNDDPSIAHVMISFGFEGKDFLVSSVEIRKRLGQDYGVISGFLNQYTIMYVLADERDVFWKNAVGFRSDVYVYRTLATPALAQKMFVDVMRRVNKLVREPEFYNTFTNNCTTNVRAHVNKLVPDSIPYDYHVLLPGYSDELVYNLGLIEKHGTFEQTKAAARINYNVYLHLEDADFSQLIRKK